MVRAAVDALDEPLDGDLGPHLQALDPHQGLRIDQRSRRHAPDRRRAAMRPGGSLTVEDGHQ